jgi:hypothetical protein
MRIITFAGFVSVGCSNPPSESGFVHITTKVDWETNTAKLSGVQVRKFGDVGGRIDITGNGALLLQRPDTTHRFANSGSFVSSGHWTSTWIDVSSLHSLDSLTANLQIYGQEQDMATGWIKFSGNPLVSAQEWKHASAQTLQLPDSLGPNDQALVRGTGAYKDQWILIFNVGGWAVGGWAAAVADSLAPLKRGKNPFHLVKPFPLFTGNAVRDTLGYHAPNDWIHVDGTWYAPDESRDRISRLWMSTSLVEWENTGPIQNIHGHDPGIAYDGEYFYLFTEDGDRLRYLSASNPVNTWTSHGVALNVGARTGDADLSFFNNAWHLFFDYAVGEEYAIGYAGVNPSSFPEGWAQSNKVFGASMPDQGQVWDEPTSGGNGVGTGDPDLALEGSTLYMTYEPPIGVAYKELDLNDDAEQSIRVRVELDKDGNGTPDRSRTGTLRAGDAHLVIGGSRAKQVRIHIEYETSNPRESPMISDLTLKSVNS